MNNQKLLNMSTPTRNTVPWLHNKIYGQDDDTNTVYKFVGVIPFALTGHSLLGLEKPL